MPWVGIERLVEPLPRKQAAEVERLAKLKKTHARFLAAGRTVGADQVIAALRATKDR